MTPNWPEIVSALVAHWPRKTIARVTNIEPRTLTEIARGHQKELRWTLGTRLLALYDLTRNGAMQAAVQDEAMRWALTQLPRMRPRTKGMPGRKLKVRT